MDLDFNHIVYLTLNAATIVFMLPPTRGEGGHTGFGADPVCVGVGVPFLVPTISLEPMSGISPNLHGYTRAVLKRIAYFYLET